MNSERAAVDGGVLAGQQQHWGATFAANAGMYGASPSEAAIAAADRFAQHEISDIIELGAGQGRDTLYFARQGFYVRALADDVGKRLGVGAHLAALRRTVSSGLTLDDATPLEFAEQSKEDAMDAVVPMESMLPQFGQVVLTDETLLQAIHGRNISASAPVSGPVRLVDQLGQLVGIGEPTSVPGVLHPAVVLR